MVAWWNRALRYHVEIDAVRYDIGRFLGAPTASQAYGHHCAVGVKRDPQV